MMADPHVSPRLHMRERNFISLLEPLEGTAFDGLSGQRVLWIIPSRIEVAFEDELVFCG